jgi:hypothetical protein
MARDIEVIWVKRERKYFCKSDWTPGQITKRSRAIVVPELLDDRAGASISVRVLVGPSRRGFVLRRSAGAELLAGNPGP